MGFINELKDKYGHFNFDRGVAIGLFGFFIFIALVLVFANLFIHFKSFSNVYGVVPLIFFTIFVGGVLMSLILGYQNYLSPSNLSISENPTFLFYMLKVFYVLCALTISGALIYWTLKIMGVFEQDTYESNPLNILLNIFLFCSMLGIMYKLINSGGFLEKNPYYRLILNIILYVPCLLVSTSNYIFKLINGNGDNNVAKPTAFDFKMLLLGFSLLVGYFAFVFFIKPFFVTRYITQG